MVATPPDVPEGPRETTPDEQPPDAGSETPPELDTESSDEFDAFLRRTDDVKDASQNVQDSVSELVKAIDGPKPTHSGTADPAPVYQEPQQQIATHNELLVFAMGSLVVARAVQQWRKRKYD